MATAREHMQADMERLFNEEGTNVLDVKIDAATVRAIVKDLETDPSVYGQLYYSRVSLWMLPGALSPLPGRGKRLLFNGRHYEVEVVNTAGLLHQLVLGRLES